MTPLRHLAAALLVLIMLLAACSPTDGNGGEPTGEETGSPSPPSTGRGYTEDEVYVGYVTSKYTSEVFASLGMNVELGDHEAQARAAIAVVNDAGGIAGRTVVPIFFDLGPESLENPDAAAEAACRQFTEDDEVVAVVNVWALGGGDDTFINCLSRADTAYISMSPQLRPQSVYDQHGSGLWAPANVSMERFVPAWLAKAEELGYFEPWDPAAGEAGSDPVVVGIVSNESVYGSEFEAAARAAVEAMGYTVASTFQFSGDPASVVSELGSAVLRFKDSDVTHVVTPQTLEPVAQVAESQGYRPRYVVSSFHNPAFAQVNLPAEQLAGAIGAGFAPSLDVGTAQDPGPVSDAQTGCLDAMETAGLDITGRQWVSLSLGACDGLNFLAAAVGETADFSSSGLVSGAASLGSLAPASTFAIEFPNGRTDGVAGLRGYAYDLDCSCFAYVEETASPM